MSLLALFFVVFFLFSFGAFALALLKLDKNRSLIEWFTLSVAVGFVLVPFFIFILGLILKSFDVPYYIIAVILIIFLISLKWRRPFLIQIDKSEAIVTLIAFLHLLLLLFYFSKYHIFPPEFFVHDYVIHLQTISSYEGLYGLMGSLWGLTRLFPHFYLVFALQTLNEVPIVALRYSMLPLGFFTPLIIYYTALKLIGDKNASLFSTAIYSFVMPFWLFGLLFTGLYIQFYSGLVSLLAVWMFSETLLGKKRKVILLLISSFLLLSHPTSFMVVFTSFFILLIGLKRKVELREGLLTGLCFVGPFAIALLVGSVKSVEYLASLLSPGGIYAFEPSPITHILMPLPFLLVFTDYIGLVSLVFFFIILAVALIKIIRRSMALLQFLPILWFLIPFALSTLSGNLHAAGRYFIYSSLPLSFMFGLGYDWFFKPAEQKTLSLTNLKRVRRPLFKIIIILFVVLLSTQGALNATLQSSISYYEFERKKQSYVYESMVWIRENTPLNAAILSLGLPWYEFSPYITKRYYAGELLRLLRENDPHSTSDFIEDLMRKKQVGTVYIVMFSLLREDDVSYMRLYLQHPFYNIVWMNDFVAIFQYKKLP